MSRDKVKSCLIAILLALITLGIYLPCLRHDFLVYDDQQYVTENRQVLAGLTWPGVKWAFTSFFASNWHPLTWLSHMADCQFYQLKPAGHHFTNVLLHAANTALLFLVFHSLSGARGRSAAVAVLFGWHPLHVESVAWVAERKDVLSTLFWLLTILAYCTYAKAEARGPGSKKWFFYAMTLVFFALGLMSKPMVVTLPFVLLLLDYWPLRRFVLAGSALASVEQSDNSQKSSERCVSLGRLILEKAPFFGMSVVGCILTLKAQRNAIVSSVGLPLMERIQHTLVAYVHYLEATFWPTHLAAYYPYDRALSAQQIIFAGVVLALVTGLAVWACKSRPFVAMGWFWYLGTLVPVIGLVQAGDQAWADRYTYVPLIGIFAAVVWGAAEIVDFFVRKAKGSGAGILRWGLISVAMAIGVALLIVTTRQISYWKDSRTLFARAAQVTKKNARAAVVLGGLLAKEGKFDEAMAFYTTALEYKPRDPEAHFYLGNALSEKGKLDAAISEYQQALWFRPLRERAHLALGMVFGKQQRWEESAGQYREALKANPESAIAENNLAKALHTQGQLDEAMAHYAAAVKLDDSLAQAHNNLGVLLLQKDRVEEGVAELRQAVRLRPGDDESEYNLALGLNRQERWQESAALFSKLIPRRPNDAKLHEQYARALGHLGKTREAMAAYAHALILQPDFPDALNGLSWILATDSRPEFRNRTEAVRMAKHACELTTYSRAPLILTLAAAYAEAGDFAEATSTAEKSRRVASDSREELTALEAKRLQESFEKGRPWRTPATQ